MLARKIHYGLIALFLITALSACAMGDPKLAWDQMSSNDQTILLDVRSQGEYDEGHLEGAVLIPVGELKERVGELGDNKDTPIVVYCKKGIRAARAQGILEDNGFTNVVNGGSYEDLLALMK